MKFSVIRVRRFAIVFLCLFFNFSFAQFDDIFNSEWSKISFNVEVQPKFDIADTKTIIISEVVNSVNTIDNHTIDIYDDMSNNITSIDGLTLIDRGKTESLLKEFKFQQSGLVDKSQIKKLGDFYGSGLLIFARIQTDQFGQSIKTSKKFVTTNGCNVEKKREGFYDLQINLKIIDLKTASIVLSQNLVASAKGNG
ncbi:MAG: penicillin-binding protein activator LpoB, partial [Winogradskyella sp.]|nr:penicillin-binding protein activator LpoB [Winogradskyella sp.]MDP5081227.1 penicillin-binding protein activator LpoB [Winogradskyella sp.]